MKARLTEQQTFSISPMLAGIDQLIESTQQQAQAMRAAQLPGRRRVLGDAEKETMPTHTLDEVDLFIGRLRQVKEWLIEDPHLLQVVDRHVSQHMKEMEKRQFAREIWFASVTTLVGAILGWLVSALASPIVLWHLLFH